MAPTLQVHGAERIQSHEDALRIPSSGWEERKPVAGGKVAVASGRHGELELMNESFNGREI